MNADGTSLSLFSGVSRGFGMVGFVFMFSSFRCFKGKIQPNGGMPRFSDGVLFSVFGVRIMLVRFLTVAVLFRLRALVEVNALAISGFEKTKPLYCKSL